MKKEILVAIDHSRHSENALKYAARKYDLLNEGRIELFHVQPTISQYLIDEARTKPKARAQLEKLMKLGRKQALAMLDDYKQRLTSMGVADTQIDLVTVPRNVGAAKDILEYATAKRFDALIVGRRGLSGLTEKFVGSVSANIVEYSEVTPVWLVDGQNTSSSVMIAVDGSESAMRAVDHMAFIFADQPDVQITFFHVTPRLQDFCPIDFEDVDTPEMEQVIRQGDRACIDRFFSHARQKLTQSGLDENQIQIEVQEGAFRVGKAVLNAFRKGGFGTLIVGRRGMNKNFFTGSVSHYLLNQFSDGALWIVP